MGGNLPPPPGRKDACRGGSGARWPAPASRSWTTGSALVGLHRRPIGDLTAGVGKLGQRLVFHRDRRPARVEPVGHGGLLVPNDVCDSRTSAFSKIVTTVLRMLWNTYCGPKPTPVFSRPKRLPTAFDQSPYLLMVRLAVTDRQAAMPHSHARVAAEPLSSARIQPLSATEPDGGSVRHRWGRWPARGSRTSQGGCVGGHPPSDNCANPSMAAGKIGVLEGLVERPEGPRSRRQGHPAAGHRQELKDRTVITDNASSSATSGTPRRCWRQARPTRPSHGSAVTLASTLLASRGGVPRPGCMANQRMSGIGVVRKNLGSARCGLTSPSDPLQTLGLDGHTLRQHVEFCP